jgi:DeoR/GlpR family transcriptional regulator of sugar metabolism
LYFDNTAVFLGSGGFKPPEIRAYQEDEKLNAKAQQMRRIAKAINEAIKNKDIIVEDDGSLTINNWDYD